MKEPLFIGAGTRGAKLVGKQFQPYIKFHGKTCLEYVVEAAMLAKNVGDIYIWGDKKTLSRILNEHISQYQQRLVIVEERGNIVESFFFSYLSYMAHSSNTLRSMISNWDSINKIDWFQLREYFRKTDHWEKQVNVIVSDTPLLSSYELDYLIENKNRDADLAVGRTVRKDYKCILERLDEIPERDKTVKNFYTYRMGNKNVSLIVNSFVAGKPFKLDENIWKLIGSFYENRTIIAGRKKNLIKIATNLFYFIKLFIPRELGNEKYSYVKKAKALFYLVNAYRVIVKSKSKKVYYRDIEKIYESINILANLTIEFSLSHCFGTAFDVDTVYEAEYLKRNFFALQNICSEYYKTHDSPLI